MVSGHAGSGLALTGEEAEVFPRKYLTLETCIINQCYSFYFNLKFFKRKKTYLIVEEI